MSTLGSRLTDLSHKLDCPGVECSTQNGRCSLHKTFDDAISLVYSHEELLKRLNVANDWLADKGVPAEHVEMQRIRAALYEGKRIQP